MKKYLLAIFVLAVLIIMPNFTPARAITADELQAQISALLAQIEKLKTQLAEIENQPKEWCYDFNTNLKIGDESKDSDALERALSKEGIDTGFTHSSNFQRDDMRADFNEDIASAVTGFQEKYGDEILKPFHLKNGTGYVGKATRAKLNELYGCKNKKIPAVPSEKGIVVNFPKNGDFISSPLTIKGYVNGNGWTGFEGQVGTVELLDNNENKLASAILEATTDWMKTLTYFSVVLNFDSSAVSNGSNGKLVFRNEDPSGNNLKTFKIPVRFKKESTNNQPPVIYGVSGPQKLDVNQQGTWIVKASSPYGGNLSYSVIWGDEMEKSLSYNKPEQSTTFTHSYSQVGRYTPTFTVISENTIRCITIPCPNNGGRAQTSITVNVENVNVSVITPTPIPFIAIYSISPSSASERATVVINGSGFKSDASVLFNPPEGPSIKASGVSSNGTKLTFLIPVGTTPGTYRVAVTNLDGTLNSNEMSFAVVSLVPSCNLTTNKSSYKYGETIVFSWTSQNATFTAFRQYADGKDTILLPGDKLDISGSYSAKASVIGNPNVTLVVYNYYGSSLCTVTVPIVLDTTQPSITVLSPNGGEVWNNASGQTIKWTSSGIDSTQQVSIFAINQTKGNIYEGNSYNLLNTNTTNDGIEITDPAITHNPAGYSNTIPPGDYVVKISANLPDGKTILDLSDAVFSIK